MPSLNDEKFAALRTQLFTGAMSDMTLQWLLSNITVPVSKTIPDAWREMLEEKLVNPDRNTGWFDLLRSLGYTGALNDMELQFWEAGGTFT